VAFRASNSRVFARQWIGRRDMRLHVEERRLPSVHVVATRAFAFVRPRGELARVRVGLVTVCALFEGNRLFEISSRVATQAVHLRMLSEQRIFRLRVVELLVRGDFFPTAGCVAGFT